jgi:hypothetical protein
MYYSTDFHAMNADYYDDDVDMSEPVSYCKPFSACQVIHSFIYS